QPLLLRRDNGDQPVRRAATAALWRVSAGLDQFGEAGRASVLSRGAARPPPAPPAWTRLCPHDGQCRRHLAVSAAPATGGGAPEAPYRSRGHRARGCIDPLRAALWLGGGGRGDRELARHDPARGLPRLDRPSRRERRVSALRPA